MTRFRILSIDGGGIKGIFPASLLAAIEKCTGKQIVEHLDLIAGTSTGGIIALGIGLGLSPGEILRFYCEQGTAIFPAHDPVSRTLLRVKQFFRVAYSPKPLERALRQVLGERQLGDSRCRLVIPAFDAIRGDVHVYKTAHHERLRTDFCVEAWQVAIATASAPTYFPCFITSGGSALIDGGLWANNPSMVALTDALALLHLRATDISMLSIGTTEAPLSVGRLRRTKGGKLLWASTAVDLLMHGQSLAATNQASLILGPDRFLRINPIVEHGRYALDDVTSAKELRGYGESEARQMMNRVDELFLRFPVERFIPIHKLDTKDQGVQGPAK